MDTIQASFENPIISLKNTYEKRVRIRVRVWVRVRVRVRVRFKG